MVGAWNKLTEMTDDIATRERSASFRFFSYAQRTWPVGWERLRGSAELDSSQDPPVGDRSTGACF
jgi:hypothetical protein